MKLLPEVLRSMYLSGDLDLSCGLSHSVFGPWIIRAQVNISSVSVFLSLGTLKTSYSSRLWVWQVSPELSICTLDFPVVWQWGAEVCVLSLFVIIWWALWCLHRKSAGQQKTLHISAVQFQLCHWFIQWRSPRLGAVIARLWGLRGAALASFWLLVLSSTAWLWKWRFCSTLQMCRDYVSNLQQCWETVFEIIKWVNLLQQSESNPGHNQSSDLGSLAGWNTAKQFWTAVITNCLSVISE